MIEMKIFTYDLLVEGLPIAFSITTKALSWTSPTLTAWDVERQSEVIQTRPYQ